MPFGKNGLRVLTFPAPCRPGTMGSMSVSQISLPAAEGHENHEGHEGHTAQPDDDTALPR